MDSLDRFLTIKQQALSSHRPCYPVPQLMSKEDERRVRGAREDLQRAYNKERAKPADQRNNDALYEMDRALNPRLCGW
jgi:hypothetical protein